MNEVAKTRFKGVTGMRGAVSPFRDGIRNLLSSKANDSASSVGDADGKTVGVSLFT